MLTYQLRHSGPGELLDEVENVGTTGGLDRLDLPRPAVEGGLAHAMRLVDQIAMPPSAPGRLQRPNARLMAQS